MTAAAASTHIFPRFFGGRRRKTHFSGAEVITEIAVFSFLRALLLLREKSLLFLRIYSGFVAQSLSSSSFFLYATGKMKLKVKKKKRRP